MALALLPTLAVGVTELYSRDFVNGTYRITTPGVYRLQEDVEFAPRADNDYWNVPGDPHYPMSAYYLGFFAAITIETADVELDLNGHTIKQGKEFYLMQRFWNAIQLADRAFVDNQGVASLNYQEKDKIPWLGVDARVAGMRSARNAFIHDGILGLSSHSGIHGNMASGVRIQNVVIRDWEVSGIHCNGCVDIVISDCTIGPTSHEVPALATFSNARFLALYTQRLIPYGFSRETPPLSHLLDGRITFADRPNESLSYTHVFTRLHRAVQLFVDDHMGRVLSADDATLLVEAKHLFGNRARLPDGAVLYGIFINHIGLPHDQENFYGPGVQSRDVIIRNTVVTNLSIAPVEVPGLQTADGTFVQGIARDLIRIFDIVSDDFRSLVNARYKGNVLSDAYFAFWKLSNEFYEARVYASGCGNFGSNSTLPWTLWKGQCTGGTPRDPQLTGRDVALLQKKYFGGIAMSHDIFKWATIHGSSLHKIFISKPEAGARRQSKHYLLCDMDTMFHAMHGVVGIKVSWTSNATFSNISMSNLINKGDDHHWVCRQEYRLPENGEDLTAVSAPTPMAGADIHGFEIVKSQVRMSNVMVSKLNSDEGRVFGIEVVGDVNDRSDYLSFESVSFEQTTVQELRAGHGKSVFPVKLGELQTMASGITTDTAVANHNNFKLPKAFIMYEQAGSIVGSAYGFPANGNTDVGVIDRMMARTSMNTERKLLAFRSKVLGFFTKQYGVIFHEPEKVPIRSPVWVAGSDSYVAPYEYSHANQYKGVSICTDTGGCQDACFNCFNHDYAMGLIIGSEGLMLHGAFGGEQGKFAEPGNAIAAGIYSFEGLLPPGADNKGNLELQYFGLCPIRSGRIGKDGSDTSTLYIDCMVESKQLGHGRATGTFIQREYNATWEIWGFPSIVFDDTPPTPSFEGANTSMYVNQHLPSPDVTFHWLADGVYQVSEPQSQSELVPNLMQHMWAERGDAGVHFLLRWTSVNSDAAIKKLRYDFMKMLHDDWGIAASNPDRYLNEPVANRIDLGGGNTVQPYVVNHWSNQRMITKKRKKQVVQFKNLDSRLHEGGFRLFVGRAGIQVNKWGFLPYGTMVLSGVYVLEGDPDFGIHEINFTTPMPIYANEWSTSAYEVDLKSTHYGEGKAYVAVPMAHRTNRGLSTNVRGAFVFKNAEGNWPGPCRECGLENTHTESIDLTSPTWTNPSTCQGDDSDIDDKQITLLGVAVGVLGFVAIALAGIVINIVFFKGATLQLRKAVKKEVTTTNSSDSSDHASNPSDELAATAHC